MFYSDAFFNKVFIVEILNYPLFIWKIYLGTLCNHHVKGRWWTLTTIYNHKEESSLCQCFPIQTVSIHWICHHHAHFVAIFVQCIQLLDGVLWTLFVWTSYRRSPFVNHIWLTQWLEIQCKVTCAVWEHSSGWSWQAVDWLDWLTMWNV